MMVLHSRGGAATLEMMEQSILRPGDVIGARFCVERQLAAGGMGTVYKAIDKQTGKTVAVKLFDVKTATDVQRAYRESQLLAQLRHPAIVAHVADGITDAGRLYLAMEWVSGVTVYERLDRQRYKITEVLALGRQIAHALAVAHDAGIVHRDVKPSNVLLRGEEPDDAVLIDFGIARVNGGDVKLTVTGYAIGTPGYMAPEQARGLRELTPAADVFSLGCVLYECLTGRPPFIGDSIAATMAKIVFSDAEPIRTHRPDTPEALAALVHRMMRRDVEQRLPDGRAVVAELDAIDPEPTPLPPPPKLAPTDRVHCIVIASHARELAASAEQLAALRDLASRAAVCLELLETNHVVVHFEGERSETVRRAASFAVAMRDVLVGWMIGVSSEHGDVGTAADTGSSILTRSVLASLFRKMPGNAIVVDMKTRADLAPVFELAEHADYEVFEIRGAKTR
jgi:eukaryotic-like serine/threonine-protein kinase